MFYKEEYTEKVREDNYRFYFIKTWIYYYTDGTTEQLIMTEKFKK